MGSRPKYLCKASAITVAGQSNGGEYRRHNARVLTGQPFDELDNTIVVLACEANSRFPDGGSIAGRMRSITNRVCIGLLIKPRLIGRPRRNFPSGPRLSNGLKE
jgi:hypothetical protein